VNQTLLFSFFQGFTKSNAFIAAQGKSNDIIINKNISLTGIAN